MALLDGFTPEQIAKLRAELDSQTTTADGRSPYRPRQLHDLTLKPTADDPRPTWFMSAEPPRNAVPQRPAFRQLLWHQETGREITVKSAEELERKIREGYGLKPPQAMVLSAADRAEQLFNALSDDDKALVLEQQRQSKIARATEALAALSADEQANITTVKARKQRGA
jgi:hypothetical protein